MADIPSMSLKVAPLQFANFTPTTYKMETADPTLLAKSLTMQEAREKETSQNIDAIDSVFEEFLPVKKDENKVFDTNEYSDNKMGKDGASLVIAKKGFKSDPTNLNDNK